MSDGTSARPVAAEAWDKLADAYDRLTPTKGHNAYYERPATLSLLPEVAGLTVLDAGCGPGHYSQWLVEHGAKVVAVDACERMVELARNRLGDRVEVHLANLERPLDFLGDASFDLVLAALCLDYVADWARLFVEFARVLKAGGRLVVSASHPLFDFVYHRPDDYFATELVEETWRGFGEVVVVRRYRRSMGDVFAALEAGGFVLERFLEPRPTDEMKAVEPKDYEELQRRPGFLCLRARRG
jgi:SAM-dependent methyltransferase